MKIKIDFQLNNNFTGLDRLIFDLIFNNVTYLADLISLLSIFANDVIANSIYKLVNHQILKIDKKQGFLSFSDGIVALARICENESFDIKDTKLDFANNNFIILNQYVNNIKIAIFDILMPSIENKELVNSIDFIIKKVD